MKKLSYFFAMSMLLLVTIVGCENPTASVVDNTTIDKDIFYFSIGDPLHYNFPSVLSSNNGTDIQSDLPGNLVVISKIISTDGSYMTLKTVYFGDTSTMIYKKSNFKTSDVVAHTEQYPFNGIGIVIGIAENKNIAFKYKETDNKISVFNINTGETTELTATRNNEQVNIQGSIILTGNGITPPNQTNVHKWIVDGLSTTAYRPFWN